jgi:hypothetical protein
VAKTCYPENFSGVHLQALRFSAPGAGQNF